VHEPRHLESLDAPVAGSEPPLRHEPRDPGNDPEQLAVRAQRHQELRQALRALPGPQRAVVFLREMEGLSTREAAMVLGISEDNVKTRLHRARVALQTQLGKGAR